MTYDARRTVAWAMALAATGALALSTPAMALSFTLTDLGTLGGNFSRAYDVNDNGQVVGYSQVGSSYEAFLWESGVMTGLGTLSGGSSYGYGINSNGEVVGYSGLQAFAGDTSSGLTGLGTLGGSYSQAYGINDSGQVVGRSDSGTHFIEAFLWESGVMTGLGTLGGSFSWAWGINNSGQVVGYADNGSSTEAFLWESGVMTGLGTLGGNSSALGINDGGQVVGDSGGAAFVWDSVNGMVDLNTLIDPALGWTLTTAFGINNHGQIVGWGTNANGHTRAYLLTPDAGPPVIPEPATLTLLGLGTAGLAIRRMRRG